MHLENVLAVLLLTTGMLIKEPAFLALLQLSIQLPKENVSAQPQHLTLMLMEDVSLVTLPTIGILTDLLVLHAQLILTTPLKITDVFALHLLHMSMPKETVFHVLLQDSGIPIPLPVSDVMLDLSLIPSTSDAHAQPQLPISI
jgi:hypothetical protein